MYETKTGREDITRTPPTRPCPRSHTRPRCCQVKDCVVYLTLAANPRDTLTLRGAINTPARGIAAATVLALELLASSARASAPTFEDVTEPECLLALLEDRDLDALEEVLARSPKVGAAAYVEDSGTRSTGSGAADGTREGYGLSLIHI